MFKIRKLFDFSLIKLPQNARFCALRTDTVTKRQVATLKSYIFDKNLYIAKQIRNLDMALGRPFSLQNIKAGPRAPCTVPVKYRPIHGV